MNNKIGVGIVTCNRQDYFEKCISSVPEVDTIAVVNDGEPYTSEVYPSKIKNIEQHTKNKSVGVSKNELMRYLIQDGCEHIFLMEDDMEILKSEVFEKYINAAKASGIWHLNYGPGSPYNREQDPEILKMDLAGRHLLSNTSKPKPRLIVDYGHDNKIALYQHSVAMFTYFHRGVIKNIGYHDEHFTNAWEHVELTYRIIKAGLHPPFWWFADIADSTEYLREIEGAIQNSVIAKDNEQWKKNVTEGAMWYQHLHGHFPAQVADTDPSAVQIILKSIKTNYAK
jgi:GT2 family glycosyltransferase